MTYWAMILAMCAGWRSRTKITGRRRPRMKYLSSSRIFRAVEGLGLGLIPEGATSVRRREGVVVLSLATGGNLRRLATNSTVPPPRLFGMAVSSLCRRQVGAITQRPTASGARPGNRVSREWAFSRTGCPWSGPRSGRNSAAVGRGSCATPGAQGPGPLSAG